MPGKKSSDTIKQVITLLADGESKDKIEEITGVDRATIYRYQKKYAKEISALRKQLHDNEPITKKEEKKMEVTEQEEKKKEFADIEDITMTKTLSKASESISKDIAKDIREDFQASQILKSAKIRYKKALEHMGIAWEDFLEAAISWAYRKIEDEYIAEVEEKYREAELKELELLQAYHEAEVEEEEEEDVE